MSFAGKTPSGSRILNGVVRGLTPTAIHIHPLPGMRGGAASGRQEAAEGGCTTHDGAGAAERSGVWRGESSRGRLLHTWPYTPRGLRFRDAVAAMAVCVAGLVGCGDASFGEEPMRVDLWQSLFTIIVFAILLMILRVVAWKPLLKALKDREEFIRNSLESAKRDRDEAEKRLKEHQARIEKAQQEASAIVDEGRRDAEALRRKINEETKQEAEAMLSRARREIGIARDTAVKDLYTLSGDLATKLAGRILQRELDAKTHERLIKESLEEIAKAETRN